MLESVSKKAKVFNIWGHDDHTTPLRDLLIDWQGRLLNEPATLFTDDDLFGNNPHLGQGVVMCIPPKAHSLYTSLIWKAFHTMAPGSLLIATMPADFLSDCSGVGVAFRKWIVSSDASWRVVYAEEFHEVLCLVTLRKPATMIG